MSSWSIAEWIGVAGFTLACLALVLRRRDKRSRFRCVLSLQRKRIPNVSLDAERQYEPYADVEVVNVGHVPVTVVAVDLEELSSGRLRRRVKSRSPLEQVRDPSREAIEPSRSQVFGTEISYIVAPLLEAADGPPSASTYLRAEARSSTGKRIRSRVVRVDGKDWVGASV